MSDINVIITDATQVVSEAGFGLTLVVCTTDDFAYKEYDISSDLSGVDDDFATNTEVYKVVNTFASQSPRPQKIAIFGVDLSASSQKATDLTAALNTLITTNNNWYRILLEDDTEALKAATASWAKTNSKIFYTEFDNVTFTTNFSANDRIVLGYKEGTERLDAGMAGYAASRIPGSFTFKFKNLIGLTADALTPTEVAAIRTKKMNCYIKKFEVEGIGTAQLDEGYVADGKYIDQVESRDYVKILISQEIARLLVTSQKVAYTNTGIQQVVSAVNAALTSAFNSGIIGEKEDKTPAFVVNYKALSQISASDRNARKLTGITFSYVEAGAIHEATVTGSVVLSL